MSSWKCEVKLRQLTPLIHFQAEQPQATLRATEVKPKLDRFLLWYLAPERFSGILSGKDEKNLLLGIARSKKWLLPMGQGDGSAALNYKMQIRAIDWNKVKLKENKVNMGAYFSVGNDEKMGVLSTELINLTVICFNEELLGKIKEVLPMFFAVHNFGFRQNKGFGSFLVSDGSGEISLGKREDLVKKYVQMINQNDNLQIGLYELEFKNNRCVGYRDVLNMIANFHQHIKSGINHKVYKPSKLLKEYIPNTDKNIENEKKMMKYMLQDKLGDKFSLISKQNKKENQENFEYANCKYVRGVLGFANHYTFTLEKRDENNKFNKINVRFKLSSENIKRFSSPLYFLPVDNGSGKFKKCLILLNNSSLQRLYKQKPLIKIKAELEANKRYREKIDEELKEKIESIEEVNLELPRKFDLIEFFKFLEKVQGYSFIYQKDNNQYQLHRIDKNGDGVDNG